MYERLEITGWTCVKAHHDILCHRTNRPVESVSLNDDNTVKLVDPISCKTKKTITGRKHIICKYKV
jgi:hypothetical protein